MKRFQNILVVTQPGFEEQPDQWTDLIARNSATRRICLMHLDERLDPLLTGPLGEAERNADLTVVSSRGKSSLSEAILSTTATEVINQTHTACRVLKHKGAGAGLQGELRGLARAGEPV